MPIFDLKALEEDFKQSVIKDSFNNMYQCLGFITAIASSPEQIKPSEWIKQLMINQSVEPLFESTEQAKRFSANLISWWSACLGIFDHGGTLELPAELGLTSVGKANKSLVDFSTGYLKGYDWLSKTWQTLLPKDNPEAARSLSVLNVILARFVDEQAIKKSHPEIFVQLPDMPGCFKALANLLSAVGMLGKDLATESEANPVPKPENDTSTTPFKNSTRTIGRNDSCPCGSGKKFKKCCLH